MCYLINQWVTYNLPIDLIDAQVLNLSYINTFMGVSLGGIPHLHVIFDKSVNSL